MILFKKYYPNLARTAHQRRQAVLKTVTMVATLVAVALHFATEFLPDVPDQTKDIVLRYRLSSPTPSTSIIVVDVDERSLALLAPEYGRWPWPRNVLADTLQRLIEWESKAVLFNIAITDPDKASPDGDMALELTAQSAPNVSYPLIRLNPENDEKSELKVTDISGAQATKNGDARVAAILPLFDAMRQNMGIANQKVDTDGVVRSYALNWEESAFSIPSIVSKTISSGNAISDAPSEFLLNWRNKNGRYQRYSLADIFLAKESSDLKSKFKDAWVVVGVSAPGLGMTKGTSVSPVEDDNEILATALDDALHGTYLRELPKVWLLCLTLIAISALYLAASRRVSPDTIDKTFWVAEIGLTAIMFLAASYSSFYIDLGDTIGIALAVYAAIKLVQSLDNRWSKASSGFRHPRDVAQGALLITGFQASSAIAAEGEAFQHSLETIVGIDAVIRIDDLYGGQSLLADTCGSITIYLCWAEPHEVSKTNNLLNSKSDLRWEWHENAPNWQEAPDAFRNFVAPLVLSFSAKLIQADGNDAE